ncbi:MAG: isoprenoid biosynthesis glyoxalase ElbB [Burkholderiales bacterium]|nr:isoprenoid biosynthesis glyoxalase ElbB [Burkholderiales bacterium]
MKVAIILSGCGVYDGAEIHESVLTSLVLARAGAQIEYLAPDMPQARVVNHLDGSIMQGEQRNVLVEAARIARGKIKNIATANAQDYQAIFFPGGFGAATNLSNFASQGAACTVQADVLEFAKQAAAYRIPACYICIAPALIPAIYDKGTQLTIGNDADTAAQIQAMGGQHINCPVQECIVDQKHNVVSTPAYMLAENIAQAAEGIEQAVVATLGLINAG